jgi:hypothetical protein
MLITSLARKGTYIHAHAYDSDLIAPKRVAASLAGPGWAEACTCRMRPATLSAPYRFCARQPNPNPPCLPPFKLPSTKLRETSTTKIPDHNTITSSSSYNHNSNDIPDDQHPQQHDASPAAPNHKPGACLRPQTATAATILPSPAQRAIASAHAVATHK